MVVLRWGGLSVPRQAKSLTKHLPFEHQCQFSPSVTLHLYEATRSRLDIILPDIIAYIFQLLLNKTFWTMCEWNCQMMGCQAVALITIVTSYMRQLKLYIIRLSTRKVIDLMKIVLKSPIEILFYGVQSPFFGFSFFSLLFDTLGIKYYHYIDSSHHAFESSLIQITFYLLANCTNRM